MPEDGVFEVLGEHPVIAERPDGVEDSHDTCDSEHDGCEDEAAFTLSSMVLPLPPIARTLDRIHKQSTFRPTTLRSPRMRLVDAVVSFGL